MNLPLIVEPAELKQHLNAPDLRIVDLCRHDVYAQQHVPGAVHLEYGRIVGHAPPAAGLLPDAGLLGETLGSLGISPQTHVVAYDDEGGGKASRLLWTLDCIGHKHFSLLNGGLHAWANEGNPLENTPRSYPPAKYDAKYSQPAFCDRAYIAAHLRDANFRIVDCRSPGEFNGTVVRAARGGHIPGAINLDWILAIDQQRNLRMRTPTELAALMQQRGITKDQEVIVYCHTHHRSAHTYIALKSLGFTKLRGYAASWSDWGNAPDTPVETG